MKYSEWKIDGVERRAEQKSIGVTTLEIQTNGRLVERMQKRIIHNAEYHNARSIQVST